MNLRALAASSRGGLMVAACSSGDSSNGGGDSSNRGFNFSGSGGTCGSGTTDSECQRSCPPVQGGGTNCCDVGSGVYATPQSTCPVPNEAGVD
jgi:hypothetical protein